MLATSACGAGPWNNPYPSHEPDANIFYSSFRERPKHLDPARSYSANEYVFIGQIYEPPLQYHYLERPYRLAPLTATRMPDVRYFDDAGAQLPSSATPEAIAYSVYEIRIQPGVRYQPHPALAKDAAGEYRYHRLAPSDLERVHALDDFAHAGSRELIAADYVYQIKRLAHPGLHSPIAGLMKEYIVGFGEYAETLSRTYEQSGGAYLDLREFPLSGVEVVDRYHYRITIRGKYPQFRYWLAMPFFAPMPWEADRFYSQPGMAERNITLDWYPIGTGPFMLVENNPNRRMVLAANPNFRGERYPRTGEPADGSAGLLADAGDPMPFVDRAVYSLEKESIPYWNKFLQGYYDVSGVSSDSFDEAIQFTGQGTPEVTQTMARRGISLETSVQTSIFYMGFNMLDPVVGGLDGRARKLRRAISIAVDYEEYISIFANGRGVAAQGPLPPGIFGHSSGREGLNEYVYRWADGGARRRPIEEARRLLAEAGYPNGRDTTTGEPLVLHFDTTQTGPDDRARFEWLRKQFAKLDIQLVVRATDYNRFQDKMRRGTAQIFQWGWNADYPDPENFLFLLYGPNAKVGGGGENAANYSNPTYDRLFERMKNMDNGPERQRIIDRMLAIVRRDAPWVWGFYPMQFTLYHEWYSNFKPNLMANNTLKYIRIEPVLRAEQRAQWNQPVIWPLVLVLGVFLAGLVPAAVTYRRRERAAAL
ncbi:MAG: ABC transporter substrate-binding protein [Gammaproteobacteria bacterium]|nr:ABC transporter substrate-binding protein [Gammaproteobacteria bacterium]NIR82871.1 ABC transporter substrate-binding protein [Gammaproteobacteria bacterium]NIR89980.1 ABC transporter substrate-binding protein [Gammaproteobacteria bacterium]NIU04029.1 ABC transporter substrate-binding protein [Gammaproteobacteria bacterium]NIV51349.1 peptide ABC transporter substrate-binding protein [Gammaproteobacteria bacterium]